LLRVSVSSAVLPMALPLGVPELSKPEMCGILSHSVHHARPPDSFESISGGVCASGFAGLQGNEVAGTHEVRGLIAAGTVRADARYHSVANLAARGHVAVPANIVVDAALHPVVVGGPA